MELNLEKLPASGVTPLTIYSFIFFTRPARLALDKFISAADQPVFDAADTYRVKLNVEYEGIANSIVNPRDMIARRDVWLEGNHLG